MAMQKVLHLHDAMEKKTCKVQGEYLQSIKYDGWYTTKHFNPLHGWGRFQSSSEAHIPALDWVDFSDMGIVPKERCIFIMEATIPDGNIYDVNSALKKLRQPAKDIVLRIHDVLYPARPQRAKDRWESVLAVPKSKLLYPVRMLGVSSNPEDWQRNFEDAIDSNEEGIVLKRAEGYYSPGKRNEDLMKLKCEVEADLLCVGVIRGFGEKGEPSLRLALQDSLKRETIINVPKDKDIAAWSADASLIVSKVVKIRAMAKLQDGKFREPRFAMVRHDKAAHQID